jgi:transposase
MSFAITPDPNDVAPVGQVWVCSCCGKRSRDRRGHQKIDPGWDSSCMTHAVLCYDTPGVSANGRPRYEAVRPN